MEAFLYSQRSDAAREKSELLRVSVDRSIGRNFLAQTFALSVFPAYIVLMT